MYCITCNKLSLYIICQSCQNILLKPVFNKREIEDDFYNYSFYPYSEIEDLISTKYHFHGDKIFNILARLSFLKFSREFKIDKKIFAIPIDDHTRHNFSHTAILARHLKSSIITPKYNTLKAKNIVKYAGKDLEFRQKNPRKFQLTNIYNQTTILCDDLITSGATIKEAKKVIEKQNNKVLFSLTLADAKF